jgi:hypothetical protein
MKVMEAADELAEEVGVLAARLGFTVDEVVTPLWKGEECNVTTATRNA